MSEIQNSFISKSFLRSVWAHEYETFKDSPEEAELIERLRRWAARGTQKETTAQSALLQEFFGATWGYIQAGQAGGEANYSLFRSQALDSVGVWVRPMPPLVSLPRMKRLPFHRCLSNSKTSKVLSTPLRNERAIQDRQ